jgi:hypothetical protein
MYPLVGFGALLDDAVAGEVVGVDNVVGDEFVETVSAGGAGVLV